MEPNTDLTQIVENGKFTTPQLPSISTVSDTAHKVSEASSTPISIIIIYFFEVSCILRISASSDIPSQKILMLHLYANHYTTGVCQGCGSCCNT